MKSSDRGGERRWLFLRKEDALTQIAATG
jgi:hypothetical protein